MRSVEYMNCFGFCVAVLRYGMFVLLRLSSLRRHCRGRHAGRTLHAAMKNNLLYYIFICALQPRERVFFPTSHHRIYEQGRYVCHGAQRGVWAAEADLGYVAY